MNSYSINFGVLKYKPDIFWYFSVYLSIYVYNQVCFMQIINSSHHQTAKNSWTSGGIATCYVGCGCTMYLPCETSGVRYDLPPTPDGCTQAPPVAHHYILCTHEKKCSGSFYARLLIWLRCSVSNAFRFCVVLRTLPKNSILGIVVHKIKKDA